MLLLSAQTSSKKLRESRSSFPPPERSEFVSARNGRASSPMTVRNAPGFSCQIGPLGRPFASFSLRREAKEEEIRKKEAVLKLKEQEVHEHHVKVR